MKIYDINKKCEEETTPDQSTTLINNIGLTYPGTAMPLRPLTVNEHNSIRGINQMGMNAINPHYGYNATGCCGSDTLTIHGNLFVSGDIDLGGNVTLHDVSANWIQYYNHSCFFTWGVHIIPKSGTIFTLAMRGLHTNPNYHVHWDHQKEQSRLLPEASLTSPGWTGRIGQDTTGYTNNDRGDRPTSGVNPNTNAAFAANAPVGSPQTPDPNYTKGISTVAGTGVDQSPLGSGTAQSPGNTFTDDAVIAAEAFLDHTHTDPQGGVTGDGGAHTVTAHTHAHEMQHDHLLFQHTHEHDHQINEDKCHGTHDHYIRDETRVWFEGWLYPGFGGYGNSTKSLGYSTPAGYPEGNLAQDIYGPQGGPGTDYDPSHNLTAYGAPNGIHDDRQINPTLFPGPGFTATATDEYTGNLLEKRPRLGGWSDRSSFPSCSKTTPDESWELGYAIATSIPFDGWLIADGNGSPFRSSTTWPHGEHTHANLNCGTCAAHDHHEHKGPSSRFSWMLGKYDTNHVVSNSIAFVLTIEFYIIRCDPEHCGALGGMVAPELIGTAVIKKRCGCAEWGDGDVFIPATSTVTIKAGDGIGLYVKSNMAGGNAPPIISTGSLHSPATFTLEVHRKY